MSTCLQEFIILKMAILEPIKKLQEQLLWTQEQKDKLWQIVTYFKINNQQDVLAMFEKNIDCIQLLADYKDPY